VQTVHLSYIDTNTISKRVKMRGTWPTSPRCSIRCVQNHFQAYGTLSASRAPILLQYQDSPNGPKWVSTWPKSPRCSIWCVQSDFLACGTFSTNRALILRQE
jgi:hypothetical protein